MQHNHHVTQYRVYRGMLWTWRVIKWAGIAFLSFIAVCQFVIHLIDQMNMHRRHHH